MPAGVDSGIACHAAACHVQPTKGVDGGTIGQAASFHILPTTGIDGGSICHTAGLQMLSTAGVDNGSICHTAGGHPLAPRIDSGIARHAAGGHKLPTVPRHCGISCHTAGGHHLQAAIDSSRICHAGRINNLGITRGNSGSCHRFPRAYIRSGPIRRQGCIVCQHGPHRCRIYGPAPTVINTRYQPLSKTAGHDARAYHRRTTTGTILLLQCPNASTGINVFFWGGITFTHIYFSSDSFLGAVKWQSFINCLICPITCLPVIRRVHSYWRSVFLNLGHQK